MLDVSSTKKVLLTFILMLGIVSLFADMTYEGARSITGPYLSLLGANATIVGFVAGFGEFVGYALRLFSGYIADTTKRYWTLTLIGYGINLFSIPLLAFSGFWEIAAMLIIMERFGKAIRTPSRDVLLSYATKQVGRGWGFGIHEALDQIGAVTGPLLISTILYIRESYSEAFIVLIIPALMAMTTLGMARIRFPTPETFEEEKTRITDRSKSKFPMVFWIYCLFIVTSVAGFANFQLISYHFKINSIVPDIQIPVLYAMAMGVDAVIALIIGRLYDRVGIVALVTIPLLTIPIPLLSFSYKYFNVVSGLILFGAVIGIQETLMRATIPDMTPMSRRGTAYGIFNTAYGLAWFFGSITMGVLYEISISYLVVFVVVVEMMAFGFLAILYNTKD
jgi:MFS family permease